MFLKNAEVKQEFPPLNWFVILTIFNLLRISLNGFVAIDTFPHYCFTTAHNANRYVATYQPPCCVYITLNVLIQFEGLSIKNALTRCSFLDKFRNGSGLFRIYYLDTNYSYWSDFYLTIKFMIMHSIFF